MQISLLRMFKIVFSRYPGLEGLSVEKTLLFSWEYLMSNFTANHRLIWSDDVLLRQTTRSVLSFIADYRGGQPTIFEVIKPQLQYSKFEDLCDRIKKEISESSDDGVELWMAITRLLRQNLIDLGNDELKAWLEIAQDRFNYPKRRKSAGIMMTFITHYAGSKLGDKEIFETFAEPYIQKYMSPEWPLKNIDATLNAFIHNSPFYEKLAPGDLRDVPDLKAFARSTAYALEYPNEITNDENKETIDTSIAHIFCHWDHLLRTLNDESFFQDCDDYHPIDRRRDIIDLCALIAKPMGWHLRDRDGRLCESGKHAVCQL
jgi:hypothetical protein